MPRPVLVAAVTAEFTYDTRIYVGSDDARVLRVGGDGELTQLRGFDVVAGRETWYAGSAVIDGQRVGPPLGIVR